MKKIATTIALLSLAGCATPTTPAPTGVAMGSAPSTGAAARGYALRGEAGGSRIVVRYRGREPQQEVRGLFYSRSLAGLEDTAVYQLKPGEDRAQVLADLRNDPDVAFAEPDIRMYAFEDANDPKLHKQWALPKMQVPAAWAASKGGPLVAVIDTGVDYSHPDLAGQVIKGYDFANHDADPMDDVGHGSHVAGAIAALTNNGAGIAGIASGSKILAVKALGPDGGNASDIADAIDYAVKNGAKIINMSLGAPEDSQLIREAITKAMAAGVLVVSAAGNDGNTTKNYPAAYKGVVAVGATDDSDNRTSFSQYGDWLTIAAPGSHIMSCWLDHKYKYLDGTSMASPQVAGVAALVLGKHPDWSAQQVKTAIETTGDPVTGFDSAPGVKRINAAKALGLSAPVAEAPAPAQGAAPEADESSDAPTQQAPSAPQQGGYPQPGMGGYPQPGMGGYPQPGMGGYPQPGMGGYPQPGMGGYPQPGMGGYPQPGMGGYPQPRMGGHPRHRRAAAGAGVFLPGRGR